MTGEAGLDPLSRFVNLGAGRKTLDLRELDPPQTPEGGQRHAGFVENLWSVCDQCHEFYTENCVGVRFDDCPPWPRGGT